MSITAINMVNPKNGLLLSPQQSGTKNFRLSSNLKQDIFIKSPQISFKGQYQKPVVENFIEKIKSSTESPLAQGWQGEFYKVNDEIGIKAPKPLHPEIPTADFNGTGNIKEYFALNKINQIDSDIAVKPHDLINNDNKNYLIMDFIKGEHPYKSKFTNAQLQDIMNKTFKLDTNGILNNDLQGGNIILTSKEKTKFIDFGSFSLLTNKGEYINSDYLPYYEYQNGVVENMINSTKEGKFMATYYSYAQPETLMRSDNPFLKIESNANVFEYRTIYDYLTRQREANPKEFISKYLNIKSQNYHTKMIDFLESLNISPNDTMQYSMHNNAIEHEKVLKEVFANPSENIMKSELGRIQIKWLINTEEKRNKTFSTFNEYLAMVKGFSESAQGAEKKYYEAINLRMQQLRELIEQEIFKGANLNDDENILKTIFNKAKENISQVSGSAQHNRIPQNSNGKKITAALAVTGLLSAGAIYAYKNYQSKMSA